MISIIVAMDENGVIGRNNAMPWSAPEDMKYFMYKTFGSYVVMGRKTYESIGRPLKGRINIVLTRNRKYAKEDGMHIVRSFNTITELSDMNNDVYIIGGAQIYKEALPIADRLFITRIHDHFDGDTYFPEFNKKEWANPYKMKLSNGTMTFETYYRKVRSYEL